jgi:PAS domain S-box-containing protein
MFSAFIWRTATVLRDSDQLRSKAERGLRQQETKLTGIIESAMDAIIAVDAEQRIVLFNPAAENAFGYRAAEVLGEPLDQLLPKRYRAAHANHLRNFATNGTTSPRMCEPRSAFGRRASGEEFPIEASISKVQVDEEFYFTVILRDITDRQRGETELRLATVEAERANNAKSRFLAAASHDLRQPLAALRLYTDVLRGKVAPAQQALVTSMDDCISSLNGLLTDLLDLSKLEASVVKPKISDFSVFECLAHLESIFTPKAQAKGLRLSFVPSSLTGRSDPTLIKRIVGNFIENAIRYTERGGVVVGCRRRRSKVWIEVWDSGMGIPADKTTEIFEEFKQLDNEARNQGSGLGLAIVAKSAALLGLEFSVRSWPGRGSVFAIELPLGHQEAVPELVSHVATFQSLRVALVEDNTLLREAMCAALQGIGHQVIAAANGATLLAELGELPPDIVVSDYRLTHGETGYDAIMAVRKAMGDDLPAIVITGDTDPKVIASMVDRGIAVLHKPFDIEDLQAYLEDLTFKTT